MRHTRTTLLLPFVALAGACGAGDTASAPGAPARSAARIPAPIASAPPVPTGHGFLLHGAPSRGRPRAAPPLRVELGASAAEPLRVVAASGGAVSVRRRGALPAAGRVEAGAVRYDGVQPGVDAVLFSTQGGVEELLVTHAPGATLAYDLDLPAGYRLHRAAVPGLVEVRDEHASARLRLWVRRAWDAGGGEIPVEPVVEGASRVRVALDEARVGAWPVVVDPEWTAATEMTIPRYQHTATTLPDGRVLIAGGDAPSLGLAETFDPRTATFTSAAKMTQRRANHTATLLPSGKVLIAGGDDVAKPLVGSHDPNVQVTAATEIFDPPSGTFTPAGGLLGPRSHHTATLLAGGKILFAGGFDAGGHPRADAELFDGAALSAVPGTLGLTPARADHAATLLADGRVLLAGGGDAGSGTLEIIAPAGGMPMHASGWLAGGRPIATLLPSGSVLLAGGSAVSSGVFDPLGAASMPGVPGGCDLAATATLLPSGRVLLAGGTDPNGQGPTQDAVTLFDPRGPATRSLHPMADRREFATATLLASGLVLLAGGYDRAVGEPTAHVELYDPDDARLESTGSMLTPRLRHTMTLLPSTGGVLVAGGLGPNSEEQNAEVFDPVAEVFHAVGPMVMPRHLHTATWLPTTRQVLIAGGISYQWIGLAQVERFDPQTEWFFADAPLADGRFAHGATLLSGLSGDSILFTSGSYHGVNELRASDGTSTITSPDLQRYFATATPLSSGQVLVAGGRPDTDPQSSAPPLSSAVLYQGTTLTPLSPGMAHIRAEHTATLLPDGATVLVTGGWQDIPGAFSPTDTFEIFEANHFVTGLGGNMTHKRAAHTATLLADLGQVLVAGGAGDGAGTSAELYDTKSGTFSPLAATLPEGISEHAATRLPNGRVLLTGGGSAGAVLYDPASRSFSTPTDHARAFHTATLLRAGTVLVTGGLDTTANVDTANGAGAAVGTADLFEPRTRLFTPTGMMTEARFGHTATLLPDGRVLVAGGLQELVLDFLPAASSTFEAWSDSGAFEKGGGLVEARGFHAATLLADGRLLLTGGVNNGVGLLASAEIVDPVTGSSQKTAGAMHHARHRHAAVRLPSGRVLVAGGISIGPLHPYDGTPIPNAEIYDPTTDQFTDVAGSAPVPGDTHAALLPSGDVLIVGDQVAYRFDEATNTLSVAGSAPQRAFGAAVLPGGRLLVCGLDRCDTGTEAGVATDSVLDGAQRVGHTLTALPHGEAFALGVTPTAARHTFSFRGGPPGVVRPVITKVPASLVGGAPAVLEGTGFQHMTARGAALPSLPHILPRVAFVPAASGAPIGADVVAWSDTSITFTAPRTPYHGGGWLVVLVDGVASEALVGGVPSEAIWTVLDPVPQGGACGLGGECATGSCSEGVCCNQPCNQGCSSCLGSVNGTGVDGVCRPIPEDGAPRFGCEHTSDDVCSPMGQCDGAGDCIYPRAGTRCDGGTCMRGSCGGRCMSNLDCAAGLVCAPDGSCAPAGDAGPGASSCSVGPRRGGGAEIVGVAAALVLAAARRRRRQKT